MTKKRYHHPAEKLNDPSTHNNKLLPEGVSVDDAAEELYDRVGERFPVSWEPWATAEPLVEVDRLPSGVTEADVESALTAMKRAKKL